MDSAAFWSLLKRIMRPVVRAFLFVGLGITVLAGVSMVLSINRVRLSNVSNQRITDLAVTVEGRTIFQNTLEPGQSRMVWFIVFSEDEYKVNALFEDGRRFRQHAGYVESLFPSSNTLDIGYGELTLDGRFKVSGPLTLSGSR
ncbi:MAG TPA: hypothetical protein VNA69_10105 [Thermoanaerobaculia bacterium]|nr:hypothetical protein [Thermoanaerobaculia bacterium]